MAVKRFSGVEAAHSRQCLKSLTCDLFYDSIGCTNFWIGRGENMKNIKNILAVMITVVMCVGFTGCGSESEVTYESYQVNMESWFLEFSALGDVANEPMEEFVNGNMDEATLNALCKVYGDIATHLYEADSIAHPVAAQEVHGELVAEAVIMAECFQQIADSLVGIDENNVDTKIVGFLSAIVGASTSAMDFEAVVYAVEDHIFENLEQ